MARRRKANTDGEVIEKGDPRYDELIEADDILRWQEAGAPTPMVMWQESQRARGEVAPGATELPEWLTVEEVAEHFKWSAKTVRTDIRAGRLLARQSAPGRPYRVRSSDAEAWATARQAPARQTTTQPSGSSGRKPTGTSFRDLVRKAR